MPFPVSENMLFTHNPLDKVICQIRFSSILKIESDNPVEFQEGVKNDFPGLTESVGQTFFVPNPLQEQIPAEISKQMSLQSAKNFEFNSLDGQWKLNLTKSYLALTSLSYKRWSEFWGKLSPAINILEHVYTPAFVTRIGLRYVDVIRKSQLGLEDLEWCEIIQPHILGILECSAVSPNVLSHESKSEVKLQDAPGQVRIIGQLVEDVENHEQCFMIDMDFSNSGQLKFGEIESTLSEFNLRAARLIRWCLTEKAKLAMKPVKT